MEAEDDLLLVIVGDDDPRQEDTVDNISFPMQIKQEVLDEESGIIGVENSRIEVDNSITGVEELIEAAEKYGRLIKLVDIKEESAEDEYLQHMAKLEEYDHGDMDDDEDYVPEEKEESSQDEDERITIKKETHRYKMLKPHEQKSFVCDLCQEYPELQDNKELLIESLSEIMRNIKPPPPPKDYFVMNGILFECIKCGAVTETMPAAQRHWQEKHGQRYLVCFACGVDFRSKTNLYKHEKRCNAPDAVTVLKARARSLGLKGRSRPYLLPPEAIKLRQKVHSKPARRFPCAHCSATFCTRAALQSHEYAHSGARPFRCAECPAAYTSRTGLKRHFMKHTDVEFICDHCERSFKTKTNLIAHLDTHLPLRKFCCEICGRRYAQKMALQLHVDRLHNNLPPPYACQICPKRYPRMSILKTHMLKEHGMNLMTRKMFYKSLPMLSETQIKQAKVVLKSEVNQYHTSPADEFTYMKHETDEDIEHTVPFEEELQQVVGEAEETELSEEILQYIKKIQQGEFDSSTQFVVIQNGEVICVNESNIDLYRSQLSEAFENDKQYAVEQTGLVPEVEQSNYIETQPEDIQNNLEEMHNNVEEMQNNQEDMLNNVEEIQNNQEDMLNNAEEYQNEIANEEMQNDSEEIENGPQEEETADINNAEFTVVEQIPVVFEPIPPDNHTQSEILLPDIKIPKKLTRSSDLRQASKQKNVVILSNCDDAEIEQVKTSRVQTRSSRRNI